MEVDFSAFTKMLIQFWFNVGRLHKNPSTLDHLLVLAGFLFLPDMAGISISDSYLSTHVSILTMHMRCLVLP